MNTETKDELRNAVLHLNDLLFGLSEILDDEDLARLRYRIELRNQLGDIPGRLIGTVGWLDKEINNRKSHPEDSDAWLQFRIERIGRIKERETE
jgi:hypothetical protein